ncbi:hypothetical protein ACEN4A_01240 [Latilactobacillus sakei]|uniref:hypothetical protein n=1 Tax=Latilactobacillus sakei TaxID=1599 RepID=UPI003888B750
MSIFDKAYKVSIPEEMVDIDNWITDEDIERIFIEHSEKIELSENTIDFEVTTSFEKNVCYKINIETVDENSFDKDMQSIIGEAA